MLFCGHVLTRWEERKAEGILTDVPEWIWLDTICLLTVLGCTDSVLGAVRVVALGNLSVEDILDPLIFDSDIDSYRHQDGQKQQKRREEPAKHVE